VLRSRKKRVSRKDAETPRKH